MGVYVKNMELPKDFFRCPFASVGCSITNVQCRAKKWDVCSGVGIGDCPLVEVKPHGRLIDADALSIVMMDNDVDGIQGADMREVNQIIADAPTVIEVEG